MLLVWLVAAGVLPLDIVEYCGCCCLCVCCCQAVVANGIDERMFAPDDMNKMFVVFDAPDVAVGGVLEVVVFIISCGCVCCCCSLLFHSLLLSTFISISLQQNPCATFQETHSRNQTTTQIFARNKKFSTMKR